MDTKGNIENHSKIKLNIYKKYLEAYLSIMINVPYYTNIFIVEPFAGKGISDNGEEGSAVIAKKAIESISNPKNKNVHLTLNDIKKESYESLVKNLEPDGNRISCLNKEANECIVDALFFLTKHMRGVEKFLAVLDKIEESEKKMKRIFSANSGNYYVEVGYESFKESGGIDYGADVVLGLQLAVNYNKAKTQSEKRKLHDEAKTSYPREIELKIIKNRMFKSGGKVCFNYYPLLFSFRKVC